MTEHLGASSKEINTLPGAISDDTLASVADVRRNWSRIIDALLGMYALTDNWDGLGAEAPGADLLSSAMDLVQLLCEEPTNQIPSRIVPTPIGTILLEWQTAGQYEEWEISEPYLAECMLKEPGKPARHWQVQRHSAHPDQGLASEPPVLSRNRTRVEQTIASEHLYQAA